MGDGFEGDMQSYAAFRRAVRAAGLELNDGRRTAAASTTPSGSARRRAGDREGDVNVVRWRDSATGRQMTVRVATEDGLIEDGDEEAAAQSDAVHSEMKPDLGGW